MRVFAGIDPFCTDATLLAAAGAVARRLAPLPAPRSLCEVELDGEDYVWLLRWGRALDRPTVDRWLGRVSVGPVGGIAHVVRREAFGLLLLLLCAEVARREAQEGKVWAVLPRRFGDEPRRLLFVQNHPTVEMKEALEAAARRFELRQVFGIAGTQHYYVSVYLQFGFTQRGISRLPFWLAGYGESESVGLLLSGDQRSVSFQSMWQALEAYRHQHVSEALLRSTLGRSAWILPEWIDEVVRVARLRTDLDRAGVQPRAADAGSTGAFLTPPVLRWDGQDTPRFVCGLSDLGGMALDADRYDLSIDGRLSATLLRQEDGSYAGPEAVHFEAHAPEMAATLAAPGEPPVATAVLQLWDPLDDVVVFELSGGRRLDPGAAMQPLREYALLTRSDIDLMPQPPHWSALCGGEYRILMLRRDWPQTLRAELQGFELWTPRAQGRKELPQPQWAEHISVYPPFRVELGARMPLQVTGVPESAHLMFARLGGRMLPFVREGSKATLEPIAITPELAAKRPALILAVRHEDRKLQLHREAFGDVRGVATRGDDGWVVSPPDRQITVAQAARAPFRFFLPDEWQGERRDQLALMEGTTFLSRLSRTAGSLGALAGYGANLHIRRGPYNGEGAALQIAQVVVDPGQLRDSAVLFGQMVSVTLDRPREPDAKHQIVCWHPGRAVQIVAGEAISVLGPDTWGVQPRGGVEAGAAIALAYDGERSGAHWPESLAPLLAATGEAAAVPDTERAALLRWMRLPILAQPYKDAVFGLVKRSPVAVLSAWLRDDGLPAGLAHGAIDEQWLAVVRRFFWSWGPRVDDVQALLQLFGAARTESISSLVYPLRAVNPLLLAPVLRCWLRIAPSARERQACMQALHGVRAELIGAAALDEPSMLAARRRKQEETIQQMGGIDTFFLERSLVTSALGALGEQHLDGREKENLQVALGAAAFRDYLAERVIDETVKGARA